MAVEDKKLIDQIKDLDNRLSILEKKIGRCLRINQGEGQIDKLMEELIKSKE